MLNIVCLKWGDKYSVDYVNRLHSMVKKNINQDFNFFCLTENPEGIDKDITVELISDKTLKGWWYKLFIFKRGFLGLSNNDQILFLDLDIIITGSLDPLTNYKTDNLCISADINENRYNSSVMCFRANQFTFIWESFERQKDWIVNSMHGDQDWIEYIYKCATIYPKSLIKSFKIDLDSKTPYSFGQVGKYFRRNFSSLLPKGVVAFPKHTSIVLFHGKPDPIDIMDAPYDKYRQAPWVKKILENTKD